VHHATWVMCTETRCENLEIVLALQSAAYSATQELKGFPLSDQTNSPTHGDGHTVFLKLMVNAKRVTGSLCRILSVPRNMPMCRSFAFKCLDRGTGMGKKNEMISQHEQPGVEIQGCRT
jgi:hypothetical protein